MANTIYTKYVVEGDDETLQCLYDTFHAHAERIKPQFDVIGTYLKLLGITPDAETDNQAEWMCFGLDRTIGRPLFLFLEESRRKPTKVFEHIAEQPPLKGHIYAIHARSDDWEENTHEFNDIDFLDDPALKKKEILDDNEIFRQFLHVWLGAASPRITPLPD